MLDRSESMNSRWSKIRMRPLGFGAGGFSVP
jgi:hypothetical protein